MSMDHERDLPESPNTEEDGGLFAARPIWEQRGRKRRGLGGRKTAAAPAPTISPEPRTFAAERDYEDPMALDTPVDPVTGDLARTSYADMRDNPAAATVATGAPVAPVAADESDTGMVAPIGRDSTRADNAPRSKGIGPAAIAAGVVVLGAIGAVGWYASRDNDRIPELAPGGTEQVATAPLPPVDLPPNPPAAADTAVNPPAPAAATPPRATVQPAAPRRMASSTRTRPAAAAAPSASDTAADASTTLPAGPQPYSTLNPGAAPPPPVNPAPTQAAPPPSEAPAAIPATPPTLPTETTPPTDPAPTPTEPPR